MRRRNGTRGMTGITGRIALIAVPLVVIAVAAALVLHSDPQETPAQPPPPQAGERSSRVVDTDAPTPSQDQVDQPATEDSDQTQIEADDNAAVQTQVRKSTESLRETEQQSQAVAEKTSQQDEHEPEPTEEAATESNAVDEPEQEAVAIEESEDSQESQEAAVSNAATTESTESTDSTEEKASVPQTSVAAASDDASSAGSRAASAPNQPTNPSEVETDGKGGGEEGVPASEGGGSGESYTWQDGEYARTVTVQENMTVVSTEDGGRVVVRSDVASAQGATGEAVSEPVFQSDTGQTMTLPGGVLLVLDPEWNRTRISTFFQDNNIDKSVVHERTFTTNAFFIETEPGWPSLNLANALAGQEGVVISSPNWQTEVEAQ